MNLKTVENLKNRLSNLLVEKDIQKTSYSKLLNFQKKGIFHSLVSLKRGNPISKSLIPDKEGRTRKSDFILHKNQSLKIDLTNKPKSFKRTSGELPVLDYDRFRCASNLILKNALVANISNEEHDNHEYIDCEIPIWLVENGGRRMASLGILERSDQENTKLSLGFTEEDQSAKTSTIPSTTRQTGDLSNSMLDSFEKKINKPLLVSQNIQEDMSGAVIYPNQRQNSTGPKAINRSIAFVKKPSFVGTETTKSKETVLISENSNLRMKLPLKNLGNWSTKYQNLEKDKSKTDGYATGNRNSRSKERISELAINKTPSPSLRFLKHKINTIMTYDKMHFRRESSKDKDDKNQNVETQSLSNLRRKTPIQLRNENSKIKTLITESENGTSKEKPILTKSKTLVKNQVGNLTQKAQTSNLPNKTKSTIANTEKDSSKRKSSTDKLSSLSKNEKQILTIDKFIILNPNNPLKLSTTFRQSSLQKSEASPLSSIDTSCNKIKTSELEKSQTNSHSKKARSFIDWLATESIKVPKIPKALMEFEVGKSVIAIGYNTHQGRIRDYNEDEITITVSAGLTQSKKLKYFIPEILNTFTMCSIFDGHGGGDCSKYLKNNLHNFLIDEVFQSKKEFTRKVKALYTKTENLYKRQCVEQNKPFAGSCACTLIICNDVLFTINVGDSRCVLSVNNGNECVDVTSDHKPEVKSEYERILKAGGKVYRTLLNKKTRMFFDEVANKFTDIAKFEAQSKAIAFIESGPWRIHPGSLSVSRTFGDFESKMDQVNGGTGRVINDPEINEVEISNADFVVLGCELIR